MVDDACAVVRQYIRQIADGQGDAQPEPAICAHIAGCPQCRGALALLLADAIDAAPARAISCDDCQRDMAAFIDIELLAGRAEAQQRYPLVWWHLWTCADCAETYQLTHALIHSDELALAVRDAHRLVRLHQLSRADLDDTLGQSPLTLRARHRGPSAAAYLLYKEPAGDGSLLWVAVQRQADGDWLLDVSVQPAPAGSLVIVLGDQRFSARFSAEGHAVVRDIAFGLLVGDDARDLDLLLEPDA